MKLRDLLEETTGLTMEQVKRRVPEATDVVMRKKGGDITFTYKGDSFLIDGITKELLMNPFSSQKRESIRISSLKRREVLRKLRIFSKEEAKEITKEIRKKSTKLPKKSFKL